MKQFFVTICLFALSISLSFSQTNDDLQEQMQLLIEQFQKNFEGNSFFQIDTMIMDGFSDDFMMPFDGNSFFFMDTLNMDSLEQIPFSSEGLGLNLQQLFEGLSKGMQQMDAEDWEQFGEMFKGFQFGQPFYLNPDELEKLKQEESPTDDSGKKKRKTIKI